MLRLWEPRAAPLVPERELLFEREALVRRRVDGDDFERDEPPDDRDEPLRDEPPLEREDPLALVFEPEPLDAPLFLCPAPEAALLLAITHPSDRETFLRIRTRAIYAITRFAGVSALARSGPSRCASDRPAA